MRNSRMKRFIFFCIFLISFLFQNYIFAQKVDTLRITDTLNIVFNLGHSINTPFDEFLPKIYKDTVSFRRNEPVKKNEFEEFIYRFDVRKISKNTRIMPFDTVPIKDYQESSKSLEKNYKLDPSTPVFFNYSDSIRRWEKPKALPFGVGDKFAANSKYNDIHPCVSITGDTIVFASDRGKKPQDPPQNNTDLYMMRRLPNGKWSAPALIGGGINTEQNEISPFIAPDGTLYYSSKGFRKGLAEIYFSGEDKNHTETLSDLQIIESAYNYDIIKAEKVGNKWANPQKLPYPINTEWDEIGPTAAYGTLIFASNRPSDNEWGRCYGGFDLFIHQSVEVTVKKEIPAESTTYNASK